MRFEHALEAARGLAGAPLSSAAVRGLERAKWRLWHGRWTGCRRRLEALSHWTKRKHLRHVAGIDRIQRHVCRRWWLRGERPTGPVDRCYTFAYVFAAVEPATGRDFCLVLPTASIAAMNEFLRRFAMTLLDDEHAVMVLDGAGWHTSQDLAVPRVGCGARS
jgi:hypothetical protein